MTGYNGFGLLVLEVDEEDNGVLGRNWIRWQCMVVNQWPRVFGLGLEWLEISVWFWCGWLEAVAWFLFLWVWEALSLVASWVLGRFFFCAVFLESEAGSSPPPFLWNSLLFMERKGWSFEWFGGLIYRDWIGDNLGCD
jgi:hypothetical protein